MIQQLSIFAENKRGAINRITQVLCDAQINMNALVTNDSAEFGIVRMVVSEPDRAMACLTERGYLCRCDRAAAAEIGDEPGSLNALLSDLNDGYINLDYLYVTSYGAERRPVAILRCADIMEVEAFLKAKGYVMLDRLS